MHEEDEGRKGEWGQVAGSGGGANREQGGSGGSGGLIWPEKTANLRRPLPPPPPPLPGVQNMFCIESIVITQHFKMTSSNQTLQARPPV